MTALLTLADFQDLAREVTNLLPADTPLTATLESVAPDLSNVAGEFEVATVQFVGVSDTRLLLAVSAQTMAPLDQSGLDLGKAHGPQVLLDSVAHKLGQGVIVSQRVGLDTFSVPSTVYFSLRAGATLHGWFALNIQEVTPMFESDQNSATPSGEVGQSTFTPQPTKPSDEAKTMRMLYDVEMTLTAEIGRAKLPVRQILDLTPGVIVELDRVAGSAADLMVNGHLVARGEVVVVDEDYGLRITEIMDAAEGLV